MEKIHQQRLEQLQKLMRQQEIRCCVICNSPNLYYITGYSPKKCERPLFAIIPLEEAPVIIIPSIYEFSSKRECAITDQRIWRDGDDTAVMVKGIFDEIGVTGQRIAIDDTFEYRQFFPIKQASPLSEFVLGSNLFTILRMRKSKEEIDKMLLSGQMSDKAMGMMIDKLSCGRSEAAMKADAEFWLTNQGMRDGFSNLIAAGIHSASPHHTCTDYVPQKGDAVWLDLGGALDHYWSDITRSIHIGKPSDRYVYVYEHVREAQQMAFDFIKPGVRACDVNAVAHNYLKKHNLEQYFIHRVGHGVGLDGHENPNLSDDNQLVLEAGMTFSCEPGCYIPEEEFGIRIEDSVCVTPTGAISFNTFTKELIIV